MSSRAWTKEQRDAIESRDGTVLVSAAAGSGKTAVLVERIIERLTNQENPCNADELLVVTFTRAAAAEIKERIRREISERLSQNPTDSHLLRQQILLDNAKIGTIDSFCADLIKENFNVLGINPDYRLIEESELKTLKDEAVNSVVEELYEENSEAFENLIKMTAAKKTDKAISEKIMKIHEQSLAYPFPDLWLERIENFYNQPENHIAVDSVWGKVIISYVLESMNYHKDMIEDSLEIMESVPGIYQAYKDAFLSDLANISETISLCKNNDWDGIMSCLSYELEKMNSPSEKGLSKSTLAETVKERRDKYKKSRADIIKLMSAHSEEHIEDIQYIKPMIQEIIHAVKKYNERLSKIKEERNGLDFSDVMHLAVSLLVKSENGKIKRTELSKELSKEFKEILIDEYQDVNEAQDMLFSALSKDESNLFMVGDVKQSIYGFRKAMPEIFISRRDKMQKYTGSNYPAKITLDCNFRSRKGITETANFMFEQLMSEDMGEINYNEDERLEAKASFSEKDVADTEMHILNSDNDDDDTNTQEVKYVAKLIKDMLNSGVTVKDGNVERKAKYGDFCVLLRSAKSSAATYSKIFSDKLIPAKVGTTDGFFESTEISVMLSLLAVIDNPLQDIPLMSVMMSPIFGFSASDIASVRMLDKKTPLYVCLLKAEKEGFGSIKLFLKQIEIFRDISASLPIKDFIRYLYDETGYLAVAGAMKSGNQRKENLYLLLDYAEKYEKTSDSGLSGFMRFIERLKNTETDLPSANVLVQAEDVVHIMTIHKSKGLEFPICIIANCGKRFNKKDFQNEDLVIHPKTGIGIKRCDIKSLKKFNTLPYSASKIMLEKSQMSEELRLLYVAVTRAKERLITVTSVKKAEDTFLKTASKIIAKNKGIPAFAVKNALSCSDWLFMTALRHPDGYELRKSAGLDDNIVLPSDFKLKVVISRENDENENAISENEIADVNNDLLNQIKDRMAYVYPYEGLSNVMSKRTASEFAEFEFDVENFAKSRPAFLNKGGLTPAQRGTATHKFMQFCNYEDSKKNLENEFARLINGNFMSRQEIDILDKRALREFFESDIARRIFASENVMREKKALINMSAGEIDNSLSKNISDENVLIEGVADCVFVEDGKLVILDFKTDAVKSEDVLVERYKKQLEVYKRAFRECMDMEVKETLLYSFALGKQVKI